MIDLKKETKTLVGMIHLCALPGTPNNVHSIQTIIDKAIAEAQIYIEAGFDALMIENMHDVPYLKNEVGPEIVAAMTAVALELRKLTIKPIGIQILAAANLQALAVAYAANLNFIRAEGFVYGHLADEGYIDSCAAELLRYRKNIGAQNIAVFTDVKKKHSSHALTADVSLAETVKTAEFFLSDGIIITGTSTGEAALIDDVKCAYNATSLPLIVGSGIDIFNLETYWPYADAFIIGSYVKSGGNWKNNVDKQRVVEIVACAQELRVSSYQ
ncbi:MAG TPA: BtpA/SgcQ family protein [Prolixibacteraceae bacterium]|nr:BtpA/SgcQ family protein [Prolixibacteraceae bacterium]HPR61670.1 BtpA/SgcQ family protein [Prolixibacteraceae bacterium]